MKKRIFAAFIALAMFATSAITSFAEYDPNKVVNDNEMSTRMAVAPEYSITINGADVEAPTPFEKDGNVMIPLRALTEALGFTVEWQGETGTIILSRGPVYITMSAFEDGYTFSKTAPAMLGTAPILIDGVTYVPVTFVDQILGGGYRFDENMVIAIYDAEYKNVALIEEINAEEKQITVNDIIMGEVVLNIADETYITDEEGTAVAFDDLEVGMTLKITYSEMMTRSLPPQNTPEVIVVKAGSPAMTLPSDEIVETVNVAVVGEVNVEENMVLVNDTVLGEVKLVFAEDASITGIDGAAIKVADLKEGMTLEVVYGEAMTMSLPPINNPVSVKVVSETPAVEITPVEPEVPAFTE
ncbi:MAG: copper amine oxidase N-terminal domain-containing protein [Clostridia bacterium]|nr:copper amine oxidase N-terminal domain-containing protein [Clostridia bacterium]